VTGAAKQRPAFNLVISNVPGSREALYLNGAHLDELYPVSIPTHYLALNITISGYGDQLGFGFIACRRSVPNLQRMLDHTDAAIAALEAAALPAGRPKALRKPAAKKAAAVVNKTATPRKRAVRASR
jgi:diacylglycerol O-acyltransferase / wax synthase